jgi:hypothetical protein
MERSYLPSVVRGCRVSEGPDNRTFIYRCLTNFGYSGAPILAQINGMPAVIGIGSGGSREQMRGIACSASQFENAVAELMQDVDRPGISLSPAR